MPKFNYNAIDKKGQPKSGAISAADEEAAKAKLSKKGLAVTGLKVQAAAQKKSLGDINFEFGAPIDEEGLALFTRLMGTLIGAGMPLVRALELAADQEKRASFKKILIQITEDVSSGNNLSVGLARHPKVFKPIYINMVRAGEASGKLDLALKRVADFMEKDIKIRKRIKSAMTYPIIVIVISLVIVGGLMVFVVPKFQEIFSSMLKGESLPVFTQILVTCSDTIRGNPLIVFGVIAGIIFALRVLPKTPPGERVVEWFLLQSPKIGQLTRETVAVRFSRVFSTLIGSGVKMLDALEIASNVIGIKSVSKGLMRIRENVSNGEALSTSMEREKILPPMVTSMIRVGEETGELGEMLDRLADAYEENVDGTISALISLLEPATIVFLSLTVGFIVLALFLPMVKIMQSLSG